VEAPCCHGSPLLASSDARRDCESDRALVKTISRMINWRLTLFTLVFFCVFVRLGFWQLDREQEKVALIAANASSLASAPVSLGALTTADAQMLQRRVVLRGYWDRRVVLLDNRILDGRAGFEVLQLFWDETINGWTLVNRGYVRSGPHRLDAVEVPQDRTAYHSTRSIVGMPWVPGGGQVHWLGHETMAHGIPLVQTPDPEQVGLLLSVSLHPTVIRLAETDPMALPRNWPVTVMAPELHRGYAVQWFLMSLAIVVMWVVFTWQQLRRSPAADESQAPP